MSFLFVFSIHSFGEGKGGSGPIYIPKCRRFRRYSALRRGSMRYQGQNINFFEKIK